MSERIAKPVVKNKFWIVEDQGQKVATIQARADGGYVYVRNDQREFFTTSKTLKQKYNIKFGSQVKIQKLSRDHSVYGFPVQGRAYNQVYDVQKKLPIYTKTQKSKSLFCAGYYLIKINQVWVEHFCPKNITINRYEFVGPFKNKQELQAYKQKL